MRCLLFVGLLAIAGLTKCGLQEQRPHATPMPAAVDSTYYQAETAWHGGSLRRQEPDSAEWTGLLGGDISSAQQQR